MAECPTRSLWDCLFWARRRQILISHGTIYLCASLPPYCTCDAHFEDNPQPTHLSIRRLLFIYLFQYPVSWWGLEQGAVTWRLNPRRVHYSGVEGKKEKEKKVAIEESDRAERTKNIHGHLALRSGEFYFSWCVMSLYNISVSLLMYVCVFWWVPADYTIARVMVSAAALPPFYRCGQISPGGASPVR